MSKCIYDYVNFLESYLWRDLLWQLIVLIQAIPRNLFFWCLLVEPPQFRKNNLKSLLFLFLRNIREGLERACLGKWIASFLISFSWNKLEFDWCGLPLLKWNIVMENASSLMMHYSRDSWKTRQYLSFTYKNKAPSFINIALLEILFIFNFPSSKKKG